MDSINTYLLRIVRNDAGLESEDFLPDAFSQVVQNKLYDSLKRLEHPCPGPGAPLKIGHVTLVQQSAHFGNGGYIGKVTLVVLNHQGYFFHVVPLVLEVIP